MVHKQLLTSVILFIGIFFFGNKGLFSEEVYSWKDLDSVLEKIESANAEFKTLKADIVYTRTITLLEFTEISEGKIRYKKPKKLYVKFGPPRNEINIVDGKYVWVYHPAEKQVEKYEMEKNTQASHGVGFFEFGYGESVQAAKKNYTITLLDTKQVDKKRFYILALLPINKTSQYSDIRLWIEEGVWLPTRIELYESGGEVVNSIEFKNITLNRGVSDKHFAFNPPRGVEVIEPLR
ncbi:MAG: outer membrane lipoprotein carrier protein LolA [Candidatus Brocadiaceae bacterium]|nr:outer membrane lipoprotein carrier protein LolA [Candidatus Brocadiaceae bacterium]